MFYVNENTTPVASTSLALQYQKYLRQFASGPQNQKTIPDRNDLSKISILDWPYYGNGSTFFNITTEGFEKQSMPMEREARCRFLAQVLENPENGA
jgi:hypothetical protein